MSENVRTPRSADLRSADLRSAARRSTLRLGVRCPWDATDRPALGGKTANQVFTTKPRTP
ncbi:hypothetical protein ACFYM0_23960 [Streptomyces sp. NPDC006487]|uniref:hypothetical protein n=1 Tax=Streptomyces sp. NPDC006487 TaxID=3364748 RepID=UPI0036B67FC1